MPNRGQDEEVRPNKRKRFGHRHLQIIFMFVFLTCSMAMRTNLSVAIVAMTDNTTSSNPNVPTYDWNNASVILSSFFWSYICLQILAGYLAKTIGPKILLLITFFINTVAFILIPIAAQLAGSAGVMGMRVVQGLAQGCLFPCAVTILGKWAPAEERSTLGMIVYSGISVGSVVSFIVTGYICSSWMGWPASFYLFGAIGLVWCVVYLQFGSNSPAVHRSISPEERDYIETSLGQEGDEEDPPIPWKSILTCIHFWAIVSANIGSAWGYTMLMTQIPTYFAKVLNFDIASNGLVSATPYFTAAVTGYIFAPLSDLLIARGCISTIGARRLFELCGAYLLVTCLMLLAFISRTQVAAVVLLSVGNMAYAATLVGYSVNHVDLSPRFAGIMHGISNCISQTIAMFAPITVHFVVTKSNDPLQWRIVFIITSLFYFICATFFVIFSSATRQKWDGPESGASLQSHYLHMHSLHTLHSMPGFE